MEQLTKREKISKLAKMFHDARKSEVYLNSDEHHEEIKETADLITEVMDRFQIDSLSACYFCIEKIIEKNPCPDFERVAELLATAFCRIEN